MTQEVNRNSIKEKCELWPIGNTMQLAADDGLLPIGNTMQRAAVGRGPSCVTTIGTSMQFTADSSATIGKMSPCLCKRLFTWAWDFFKMWNISVVAGGQADNGK